MNTAVRYGNDLAKIMKKSLLIGQVASLSRDIEVSQVNLADFGLHVNIASSYEESDDMGSKSSYGTGHVETVGDETSKLGILDGIDISSRRVRINQLLGTCKQMSPVLSVPCPRMLHANFFVYSSAFGRRVGGT